MFSICKNFIEINGDLFLVKRTLAEDRVINIDLVKEFFNVETVYKKEGVLYFCNKIEELKIIN